MLRFPADADFNYFIVKGCRRSEPALDFRSANEAGLAGLPDPEVLTIAAAQNRILVTHDAHTMPRHFGDFLTAGHPSPGVLLVSQQAPIGDVIEELVLIWAVCGPDEYRNRFVRIL